MLLILKAENTKYSSLGSWTECDTNTPIDPYKATTQTVLRPLHVECDSKQVCQ